MQHIPKQSHYVRCPALKLLCTNLCGPLTKNFVDPALDHACLRLCSEIFRFIRKIAFILSAKADQRKRWTH